MHSVCLSVLGANGHLKAVKCNTGALGGSMISLKCDFRF